jgi:hypothetical protein
MHIQSTLGGAAVAVSVPGLMPSVEHAPQRIDLRKAGPSCTDSLVDHSAAQVNARACASHDPGIESHS